MENKNIHLIPTDKPSRLFKNLKLDTWDASKEYLKDTTYLKNHNIYITDDSEIKEGDWYIYIKDGLLRQYKKEFNPSAASASYNKKIILTTDQDLIKDGVQVINDEFLEWFVKNPSCERVEVIFGCLEVRQCMCDSNARCLKPGYEIIIPKEEPKYILCGEANKFYRCVTCDAPCGSEGHYIEEPKQETLEEAAERIYQEDFNTPYLEEVRRKNIKDAMIKLAKWQQEQDKNKYSEEDMKLAFEAGYRKGFSGYPNTENWKELPFEKWFEQFKKK